MDARKKIREKRESAGLSRRAAAEDIGIDANYLYRIEAGRRWASYAVALRLAAWAEIENPWHLVHPKRRI